MPLAIAEAAADVAAARGRRSPIAARSTCARCSSSAATLAGSAARAAAHLVDDQPRRRARTTSRRARVAGCRRRGRRGCRARTSIADARRRRSAHRRGDELPAWSLPRDAVDGIEIDNPLPERVDRDWAFGGATGRGVKVCILDSGVEAGHPRVGEVASAVAITIDEDGEPSRARTIARATSAGTAPPAPASSARSRPRRRSIRCACSAPGFKGSGACSCRRPALGGRPGLRRDQHEPLDDEARSSATCCTRSPTPPTSSARCSSPRRTTCRSSRSRGGSRPSSRWGATRRTTRCSSTPTRIRPSSSSRAASTSSRLDRRRHDPRDRQQLRDAVHLGDRRADPRQASAADAVPAEDACST